MSGGRSEPVRWHQGAAAVGGPVPCAMLSGDQAEFPAVVHGLGTVNRTELAGGMGDVLLDGVEGATSSRAMAWFVLPSASRRNTSSSRAVNGSIRPRNAVVPCPGICLSTGCLKRSQQPGQEAERYLGGGLVGPLGHDELAQQRAIGGPSSVNTRTWPCGQARFSAPARAATAAASSPAAASASALRAPTSMTLPVLSWLGTAACSRSSSASAWAGWPWASSSRASTRCSGSLGKQAPRRCAGPAPMTALRVRSDCECAAGNERIDGPVNRGAGATQARAVAHVATPPELRPGSDRQLRDPAYCDALLSLSLAGWPKWWVRRPAPRHGSLFWIREDLEPLRDHVRQAADLTT